MKQTKTLHDLIFSEIYNNRAWGESPDGLEYFSGAGSELIHSTYWIDCIIKFIHYKNINSIVDIGCGDFTVSKEILRLTENIEYIGYDVFPGVIECNKKKEPQYEFEVNDVVDTLCIKECDLILLKDVLQHWENKHITTVLDYIINNNIAKYIIICNCSNQINNMDNCDYSIAVENINKDINQVTRFTGRPLHSSLEPLNMYNIVSQIEWKTVPDGTGQPKEISIINI